MPFPTVDVSEPYVATLRLDGLPAVTPVLDQRHTGLGSEFPGWAVTGGTFTDSGDGTPGDFANRLTVTSATAYLSRSLGIPASAFNGWRLRALVSAPPEQPPILVQWRDGNATTPPAWPGRYVGPDRVWVDSIVDSYDVLAANSVRLYATRPAGLTSAIVYVHRLVVELVDDSSVQWQLDRADHNGVQRVVDWTDLDVGPYRRNLVSNPQFDVDATGWNLSGTGTTAARSTAQSRSGPASLLVTTTTTATAGVVTTTAVASAAAGETWQARASVRPSAVGDYRITFGYLDAGGAVIGASLGQTFSALPANVWSDLVFDAPPAPLGTDRMNMFVRRINGVAATTFYLDDVHIVEVVDGNVPSSYVGPAESELYILDREPALGVDVTWTLGDGGVTFVDESVVAVVDDVDDYAAIVRPLDASSTLYPVVLFSMTNRRSARAAVLDVESDPYPAVASRPLSSREQSFTVYAATYDDAELVADELATGELVMLRQPIADQRRIDCYIVATDVSVNAKANDDGLFEITGTAVETRRGVA